MDDQSPLSHKMTTLRKRRYRQLERQKNLENDDIFSSSVDEGGSSTSGARKIKSNLKLNQKILKKASATVDLISQKVKGKNVIQETVSSSFVTNVIEITKDALKTMQKEGIEGDDKK